MKYMNNNIKCLLKSILAGICIGIGGTIYLMADNKVVGAFLFAIGLFVIVSLGLNLFTGKIGYVFNNKPKYLIEVLITLVGNFFGTFLTSFLLTNTRIYDKLLINAMPVVNTKLDDNLVSILILSIFCGLLMYIAVNGYKTIENTFGKILIVFLCVSVFILCGFEHSIANMYYFSVAGSWSWSTLLYLLFMIIGNSIGSFIFPLIYKYIKE